MPCFRHALAASFALIICSIFHVVSQRIVLHRRRGSHDALPVSQGEGRAGTSMSCNYIMPVCYIPVSAIPLLSIVFSSLFSSSYFPSITTANIRHQSWHLFDLREHCFAVLRAQRRPHSAHSLLQPLFSAEASHHTRTQPTLKFHTKKPRVLGRRSSANSTSTEKCSWLQVQHAVLLPPLEQALCFCNPC
jgi:hypothetical protein